MSFCGPNLFAGRFSGWGVNEMVNHSASDWTDSR